MNATIASAWIGLIGGFAAVVATYVLTKRREREAEWRVEKLAYYKAFIESLSGIVSGDDTPESHLVFARATNNLLLFAPQNVIDSINAFRHEIRISNPTPSRDQHDKLLKDLLLEVRRDIGVYPADDPSKFEPILWASGRNKDSPPAPSIPP
jgi:hypothetical protein